MKKNTQLIKLLEKKSSPEIVVKYIYLNIFELIKESLSYSKFGKGADIFDELSFTYANYFDIIIDNYEEEWVKTIFPPYIQGYKNFYQGVAGRLAFFSVDIDSMKKKLTSSERTKDLTCRIVLNTPEAYYWYGNPNNWSYCYEIKLNESKELVIKKRQILALENESRVYEEILDGNEGSTDMSLILLLYKASLTLPDIDDDKPYPYPTRRPHVKTNSFLKHNLDESIAKMMSDYKLNVSKKTGYSPQIQKLWLEYNEQEAENSKKKNRLGKYNLNYKDLKEEEILELEKKFINNYKIK